MQKEFLESEHGKMVIEVEEYRRKNTGADKREGLEKQINGDTNNSAFTNRYAMAGRSEDEELPCSELHMTIAAIPSELNRCLLAIIGSEHHHDGTELDCVLMLIHPRELAVRIPIHKDAIR